jgi:hypothetical protein
MNHVVNEYDDVQKIHLQSARILHEEQSWAAVADKIIERLEEFEKLSNLP